ncbi:MAG: SOS response-associated peptidase [Nitrospirae bacterium]|nr:MAG: SOS response-associated peptidase [Nitrospirota bacterium]
MCGRITLTDPTRALAHLLGAPPAAVPPRRYNVAPGEAIAAVRAAPGGGRELVWLRWGLIPPWAKEARIGHRMINARAETVAERPAFRASFRHRRCLIPVDGFYEWGPGPGGRRQPYWITLADGTPFALAGLWERWRPPEGGEAVESCTILTCPANDLVAPIHPRMPVILPEPDHAAWLDPALTDPGRLRPLLRPYPARAMRARPASTRVNDPRHDAPDCLEP